MSETVRLELDTTGVSAAAEEVERVVREDILPMADLLDETFATVARSIEDELEKAARRGSLSMKTMVNEILEDLAKLAAEKIIREPLSNALGQVFQGVLGGAEQAPAGPPAITVNMLGPQTGQKPTQAPSETQIAAALQRALASGLRNT